MCEQLRPDVFFWVGEIEAWGHGVQRIFQVCREANSPESQIELNRDDLWLQFAFASSYLQAVGPKGGNAPVLRPIGKTSVKTPVKTTDSLLELLRQSPQMTLAEVAARVGRTVWAVEMATAKLVKTGRLRFVGPQKGGHWEVLP
jgi:ATP-dependent DNA helicase RecG